MQDTLNRFVLTSERITNQGFHWYLQAPVYLYVYALACVSDINPGNTVQSGVIFQRKHIGSYSIRYWDFLAEILCRVLSLPNLSKEQKGLVTTLHHTTRYPILLSFRLSQ